MRRLLLLLAAVLFGMNGMAQLVPTQNSAWLHITENSTVKRLIDIDNVGANTVQSSWVVSKDEVKPVSGWDVEFCDCNNCYSFKDYPNTDTCIADLTQGDFATYSLQVKPGSNILDKEFQVVVLNLTDGSETDTLTFKVSSQAATGFQDKFSESGYKIYPNPTKEAINIAGMSGGENYRILDISGKEIMNTNFPSIDVSSMPAGAYLLEIDNGNKVVRQRFMKD